MRGSSEMSHVDNQSDGSVITVHDIKTVKYFVILSVFTLFKVDYSF